MDGTVKLGLQIQNSVFHVKLILVHIWWDRISLMVFFSEITTSAVCFHVCEFCDWVNETVDVQWPAGEILLVISINDVVISNSSHRRQSAGWVSETSWSRLELPWRHRSGDVALLYQILTSSLALPESPRSVAVSCTLVWALRRVIRWFTSKSLSR